MSENGTIEGAEWAGSDTLPWHQIWLQALTRPSLSTYRHLLSLQDATRNRAYKWMAGLGLLNYILLLLIPDTDPDADTLVCAPVIIFVPVLGLALWAIINHILVRILGGDGSYDEMVFALGMFQAPLYLVTVLLTPIPIPELLILPVLLLFQTVLGVIAINAVYDVGWPKAAIAATAPMALVLLIIALGFGFLLFSLA